MLTTVSNFKTDNELALAFQEDGIEDRRVCAFINDYEPRFLLNALGKTVMDLFDTGLTAEEQRWEDLRDGVTYNNGTTDIYFPGIKPLIQRYIYCYYQDYLASTVTSIGDVKQKAQNAEGTNVDRKVLRIWNQMGKGVEGLWDFLYERKDEDGERVYPEWESRNTNLNHFRPRNQFGI